MAGVNKQTFIYIDGGMKATHLFMSSNLISRPHSIHNYLPTKMLLTSRVPENDVKLTQTYFKPVQKFCDLDESS